MLELDWLFERELKAYPKKAEEILEEGENYKIIKAKGEKLPIYVLSLPKLTESEKKLLRKIERRAIAEINIDPENIPDEDKKRKVFLYEVLKLIKSRFPEVRGPRRKSFAELIVQDMIGYGMLEPLIRNDALEEIMVVGIKKPVYVYHRKHGMCKTNIVFEKDIEIERIVAKIARSLGRRIDFSCPLLDARLPDGSRVNATIRPISLEGPTLTIRKFRKEPFTIIDLIKYRTLNLEVASFLWLCVDGLGIKPANILVAGGSSSGKTTTLNCLASFIPPTERVISIEDTAELQLPIEHWIRLETRPPNVEGRGEVSMDELVKNTLRMRPDRIIVGEVRGEEARTLLAAMNTGQSGCMGTVHANNARETVTRLTSSPMNVPSVMIPSLDFIIMQNRFIYKGKLVRRITEIAEVVGIEDGEVVLKNLFTWDPKTDTLLPTGERSNFIDELLRLKGVNERELEKELERREKILKRMQENSITSLREVGRIIRRFYAKLNVFGEEKKRKKTIAVEEHLNHKIVQFEGEIHPVYELPIPDLTKEDKKLLKFLEDKAIREIMVSPIILRGKRGKHFLYGKVFEMIKTTSPGLSLEKQKYFANLIVQNMVGYGAIDPLLRDDSLEEVMIISHKKPVYVNHRGYGICKTNITFEDEEEVLRIIERIAASVGRRIDKAVPLLDARLPDGSRVNATIRPISLEGPTLTIRKFRKEPFTIIDLIKYRTLNLEVASFLWLCVDGLGIKPANILVAGGSSSGKTTTLNCLASFIPPTERVISIEDTAELQLPIEHWIRLETRPPNVEGRGEVSMDELVKNTLRMRPDRIIVGEVRGEEARTLFIAMNTGHEGCMGTVHSNSARETIIRLTNPPMNVPKIMIPALDLIIMQNKIYKGDKVIRRITEITEVCSSDEKIELNPIYVWDPRKDDLVRTKNPSRVEQRLAELKGWGEEEIKKEWEKRKAVLAWAAKGRKKRIYEVIGAYYTDPYSVLDEVGYGE